MSIVGPRPLLPDGESIYSPAVSKVIRSVAPGVTGIGSLVLRDEESYYAHRSNAHDFYREAISPYKGSLEVWYVNNRSTSLKAKIIAFTFIAILFPNVNFERYFLNLPIMPKELINSKKKD